MDSRIARGERMRFTTGPLFLLCSTPSHCSIERPKIGAPGPSVSVAERVSSSTALTSSYRERTHAPSASL